MSAVVLSFFFIIIVSEVKSELLSQFTSSSSCPSCRIDSFDISRCYPILRQISKHCRFITRRGSARFDQVGWRPPSHPPGWLGCERGIGFTSWLLPRCGINLLYLILQRSFLLSSLTQRFNIACGGRARFDQVCWRPPRFAGLWRGHRIHRLAVSPMWYCFPFLLLPTSFCFGCLPLLGDIHMSLPNRLNVRCL